MVRQEGTFGGRRPPPARPHRSLTGQSTSHMIGGPSCAPHTSRPKAHDLRPHRKRRALAQHLPREGGMPDQVSLTTVPSDAAALSGYYTYRSFLNRGDPVGDFNQIRVAEAELALRIGL